MGDKKALNVKTLISQFCLTDILHNVEYVEFVEYLEYTEYVEYVNY